ncbi:hypothetical protein F5X68DRAFT_231500 [Plectosphaerella plurivora]|uniref:4Fe-4S ferredoxin-type domain-containing protein n=1 Tax=Plectosphaerella plurivora TaxID=936078 RepID=A0A9P8VEK0_9PEZI|nr:hypothetical protein F5X68DRAFT_231500 [Plectosphaerella plurivora]
MADRPNETCWFFVDDSNIWIEAQKAAAAGNTHLPKLTDSDRDPRLRIDIGKMVTRLRKGRARGPSSLYGSRPPPNDSVWDAFKKFDFDLHIFDRNDKNKEKEVDNAMSTNIVKSATRLAVMAEYDAAVKKEKDNTIFVIITGDRDMMPSIKEVLAVGIRVELWAWKSGMAGAYKQLRARHQALLSLHFLDDEAGNIYFTNTKSTRKGKPDPVGTVVLCVNPPAEIDEHAVIEKLFQLSLIFYTNATAPKTVLFVEFPNVRPIDAVLHRMRRLFAGHCEIKSYVEYANSASKTNAPAAFEDRNVYTPLDNRESRATGLSRKRGESGDSLDSPDSPDSLDSPEFDNGGDWTTVTRSDPKQDHRRRQRQAQPCPEGVRCRKRGDCAYRHSPEEIAIFQSNPDRDMRWWKTRKCNKRGCREGRQCPFAHTDEESWCIGCKVLGHCLTECPIHLSSQ